MRRLAGRVSRDKQKPWAQCRAAESTPGLATDTTRRISESLISQVVEKMVSGRLVGTRTADPPCLACLHCPRNCTSTHMRFHAKGPGVTAQSTAQIFAALCVAGKVGALVCGFENLNRKVQSSATSNGSVVACRKWKRGRRANAVR
jgi:hypothetical protein